MNQRQNEEKMLSPRNCYSTAKRQSYVPGIKIPSCFLEKKATHEAWLGVAARSTKQGWAKQRFPHNSPPHLGVPSPAHVRNIFLEGASSWFLQKNKAGSTIADGWPVAVIQNPLMIHKCEGPTQRMNLQTDTAYNSKVESPVRWLKSEPGLLLSDNLALIFIHPNISVQEI